MKSEILLKHLRESIWHIERHSAASLREDLSQMPELERRGYVSTLIQYGAESIKIAIEEAEKESREEEENI